MTHLKCYFYKERKKLSSGLSMSHILLCSPQGIGKTAKKCHKFVPTAWRHPPPSFFLESQNWTLAN